MNSLVVSRAIRILALGVAVASVGVPTGATWAAPAAAPAPSPDPAAIEARRHYEEGTKAFNLGEFNRAVSEFKAAYNLKPDPLLLYNIGQAFRLAGNASQAIFFYKSFLRNMPDAPQRAEVEQHIESLEKQAAAEKNRPATAPAASAPPLTPPPPATSPATSPHAQPATPAPVPTKTTTTTTTTTTEPLTPPPTAPPPAPPPAPEPGAPSTMASGVDLTAPSEPAPPPEQSSSPFYKKWWFWTGVGVVLLIGVAAASRPKPPSTELGLWDPQF